MICLMDLFLNIKKQIKKEETGNSFEGKYFSTCDELTPDSVYVLQDGDRLLEIDWKGGNKLFSVC